MSVLTRRREAEAEVQVEAHMHMAHGKLEDDARAMAERREQQLTFRE